MTYHSKIVRRPGRSAKSMVAGVATINIDQSMRLARKQMASGSIRSDWEAVGRDLKGAVRRVKREFESA
jgi:hypothetical protein